MYNTVKPVLCRPLFLLSLAKVPKIISLITVIKITVKLTCIRRLTPLSGRGLLFRGEDRMGLIFSFPSFINNDMVLKIQHLPPNRGQERLYKRLLRTKIQSWPED